jgi:hypothetical protein
VSPYPHGLLYKQTHRKGFCRCWRKSQVSQKKKKESLLRGGEEIRRLSRLPLLRSAAEPRRRPAPRGGADPGCLRACGAAAAAARTCAASPATTRSRPPPPARTASSLGLGVPIPPPRPLNALPPPDLPVSTLPSSLLPLPVAATSILVRACYFDLSVAFGTHFCWIGLVLIGCSLSRRIYTDTGQVASWIACLLQSYYGLMYM